MVIPTLIQVTRRKSTGHFHPVAKHKRRCPDRKKDCNDCRHVRDIATPGNNTAWCVVFPNTKKKGADHGIKKSKAKTMQIAGEASGGLGSKDQ